MKTFNIVLAVILGALTATFDAIAIVAVVSAPLWKTHLADAIFWTFIFALLVVGFTAFVIGSIKHIVFDK